ncbi:MAG TPA: glycosyltransferase family 4 protein, partial [Phycisphaerales bacterium]|nr:glycosyltransferase family 4 protein [Phycisphaerales bacterium]
MTAAADHLSDVSPPARADRPALRLLIVCQNASMRMGGEASLPLYYFRILRRRGHDVRMVTHARVRDELRQTLPASEFARVGFVEDTRPLVLLWKAGERLLPNRVRDLAYFQLLHLMVMRRVRRRARALVGAHGVQAVFEPMPITPRGLSVMHRMGAAVVIGPMCGGLEFPPAFRRLDSAVSRVAIDVSRRASDLAHRLVPGKRRAQALLVADRRTAAALPRGCRGRVYQVVESGVDLAIWKPRARPAPGPGAAVRYVFAGRFVDVKGISYLVRAVARVPKETPVILELVGDGPLRSELEGVARAAGVEERVRFRGWLSRPEAAELIGACDVFVLPSLRECGGTAILEAMAMGLPVIVTNWAGPRNYVTPACGILVDPDSPEGFVRGLSDAIARLARDPGLRARMGEAG